ncbi:hypothetical protein POM88_033403 [Heracleum sosnowskyi]|uniref:PORR domain-containing protein n=1 Tax=Heracleum sosnowskyi TaxID=360622 RepID=A0AAD8I206_9APIA|nr:hypothetical protein POM88_033403 [Heracleum sosnowskyi]
MLLWLVVEISEQPATSFPSSAHQCCLPVYHLSSVSALVIDAAFLYTTSRVVEDNMKLTKVVERHPGIFYLSKKCDTQTLVLKEAYERDPEIPLVVILEKICGTSESSGAQEEQRLIQK